MVGASLFSHALPLSPPSIYLQVLAYHVIPGALLRAANLTAGAELPTMLGGQNVTVSRGRRGAEGRCVPQPHARSRPQGSWRAGW